MIIANMSGEPPLKKVRLNKEELEVLSKEELIQRLEEQNAYIDTLLCKQAKPDEELMGLRESEERLKQQQTEATRRENVLVMRLTAKEQEMQDYLNQIQELKQAQNPSTTQLRGMLLDPAINLMFQRMKKEIDAYKEKLEQAQNDLAAWKFTPDSQTGKRLMAKCRMLLQENEDLGKQISSGRTAKLEGEIALQKELVKQMKDSETEMEEFVLELDEGMEGLQSTIIMLQQQLKETQDHVQLLQEQNQQLRNRQPTPPPPASPPLTDSQPVHSQRTNSHTDEQPAEWPGGQKVESDEPPGIPSETTNDHAEGMETDSSEHNRPESPPGEEEEEEEEEEGEEEEEDGEEEDEEEEEEEVEGEEEDGGEEGEEEEGYRTQGSANVDYEAADATYPAESTDASNESWSSSPNKPAPPDSSSEQIQTKPVYRTNSAEDNLQNGSIGSPESVSQEESHDDT